MERNPKHHVPHTELLLEPSGIEIKVKADTVTLSCLNVLEVLQIEEPIFKFHCLSWK